VSEIFKNIASSSTSSSLDSNAVEIFIRNGCNINILSSWVTNKYERAIYKIRSSSEEGASESTVKELKKEAQAFKPILQNLLKLGAGFDLIYKLMSN